MNLFIASLLLLCIMPTTVPSMSDYAFRTAILDAHNDFRDKLTAGKVRGIYGDLPGAADGDIPDLTWDYALAELAEEFAATCPSDHESSSVRKARFINDISRNAKFSLNSYDGIGENIAYDSPAPNDDAPEYAVQRWADEEAALYNYGKYDGDDYCSDSCGHFTQVAWANTLYVGCGMADCSADLARGSYATTIVCNYYPPGNYPLEYPYPCKDGDDGCPAVPVDAECPVIEDAVWYVDGDYEDDGEYNKRKSYKARFNLFWTGSQWNVADGKGATPYARCYESDIMKCGWANYGSSKTKEGNCGAFKEEEESKGGGEGGGWKIVLVVVLVGFLLIGVGNVAFCWFMKRKMMGSQKGIAVLEEDEAEREDLEENETALTQN